MTTSVTTQPSAEAAPEPPPVPLASSAVAVTPPPQDPQPKKKQSSEATAEAKPATQTVVGTKDLNESPGVVTAGELSAPSSQPPAGLPAGPPPADVQLSAPPPPASMQSRSDESSLVPVSGAAPEPENESQQNTQPQAADSAPTMPDGLSKMEQMKVSISAHSLQPDVDFCRWRYTLIGCVVSFVRTVEAGERCDNIRDYATFSRGST